MTEIVVLGGGFAGVFAAKELRKRLDREQFRITLVDKNSYHLFIPSLYEVATAEEPRSNICIPFSEIFPHGVQILKAKVLSIDKKTQRVKLNNSTLRYDYLVIALGSETQYYDIEGLAENAIAFKSLEEACEIKDKIRKKYEEKSSKGQALKIVIGGGGTTGVELGTEVAKYLERLGGRGEIHIFQRSGKLLKGVDPRVSAVVHERLESSGIKIHLNSKVKKVDKESLEVDGEKHSYDILIWTGGIRPSSVIENSSFPKNTEGWLSVDEYLRVKGETNVFAAGDISGITPRVAQVAHEEGTDVGKNIVRQIRGEKLVSHKYRLLGYLIPLFGKYVVVNIKGLIFGGFLGFIFQQLIFLRYLLMILPPWKAFKRWNRFENYLARI